MGLRINRHTRALHQAIRTVVNKPTYKFRGLHLFLRPEIFGMLRQPMPADEASTSAKISEGFYREDIVLNKGDGNLYLN
jgi:hypothetical protein